MSDAPAPRTGRFEKIFVAVVVAGSAVAVIGWYLMTNRTGLKVDVSGFDLNAAPGVRPVPAPSASRPAGAPPPSSLGMLKGQADIRFEDPNAAAPAPAPSPSAGSTASKAPPTPTLPPGAQVGQNKTVTDAMSNPEVQKALKAQGQQAPPVSLPTH